ncbi:MAG: DUF2293 domain-containing protein [Proteobacteria bacterium]|nr:DUF2293 domain-containing protein [Pseudomonadota bacterium]MBU1708773.1 DUF2293 domain-containing protein [Pseudomonadota bacterium]
MKAPSNLKAPILMADLRVFITHRDSSCVECEEPLTSGDMIGLTSRNESICLTCADLDHLVFLPSGNAVLTRRSQKHSKLSAIVWKFSKARKRSERQGVLVEAAALKKTEIECLDDEEVRKINRDRNAIRREKLDREYINKFSEKIKELFPRCPKKTAAEIAEHACLKYSGRVGRSASAKSFDENAVHLAVQAHIRHSKTNYDNLLNSGCDRCDARQIVREKINDAMSKWSRKK